MILTLGFVLSLAAQLTARELASFPVTEPPPGAVVWMSADHGVSYGLSNLVESWEDRSGVGNVAEQPDGARRPRWAQSALNGRVALHFDGNDFLDAPAAMPLGSYTKVILVQTEDFPGAGGDLLSGVSGHGLAIGANGIIKVSHAGNVFISAVAPGEPERPLLIVVTYDAGSNRGSLYVDGVLIGTDGASSDNLDPTLRIGSPVSADTFFGTIPELLVYDRVLDPVDLKLVVRYLRRRYLTRSAPVVEFDDLPLDGQLFPRVGAEGTIRVSGVVQSPGYDAIEAVLSRGDQVVAYATNPLVPDLGGGSAATFSIELPIVAGRFDHTLRVRVVDDGRKVLVARRRNLVSGDVYLVHGQSNAAAPDIHEEGLAALDESRWVRSFGLAGRTDDVPYDLHWDVAEALFHPSHAGTGAFAVRMGRRLTEALQVPVAIFNGAEGSTFISQHQRNNADPDDLATLYGRLLARASQAGVAESARALIWYQGESDAGSPGGYGAQFDALRNAWSQDYPGLDAIYVLQVREGCGYTTEGVRGLQRELPEQYPDVRVMSTTAVPGHDGCHYYHTGYAEIGERLARVLARDLHFAPVIDNVDPPNVSRALVEGGEDVIRLVFENPEDTYVWQPGSESYFVLDDSSVSVLSGAVDQDSLLLQLSGPTTATTISYVGHSGDGPWVTNALGVGALTFFQELLIR